MPISIIISYDGTAHDDDALMLGRMLSAAGASLSLAYVRHSREYDPRREEIGVHDADRRLEQGAVWLGDEAIKRHVVVNPSTGAGLADLAASEGATAIVFGSDYRTPPGRVEPGGSAQGLLDGGTVAIGVAAAGLRTRARTDAANGLVPVGRPGRDRLGDRAGAGQRGRCRAHRRRPRRRSDRRRLARVGAGRNRRDRRDHEGLAGVRPGLGAGAPARHRAVAVTAAGRAPSRAPAGPPANLD